MVAKFIVNETMLQDCITFFGSKFVNDLATLKDQAHSNMANRNYAVLNDVLEKVFNRVNYTIGL